jgi:hypothetical protein
MASVKEEVDKIKDETKESNHMNKPFAAVVLHCALGQDYKMSDMLRANE